MIEIRTVIHLLHDIGIGFFLAIAFVILRVGPVFYREWHVRYREKMAGKPTFHERYQAQRERQLVPRQATLASLVA
jgi:hypothetical protein